MALNREQTAALNLATTGHNLLITGSAGTGKSHIVKVIAKNLIEQGKHVHITCSTGIACSVYNAGDRSVGACTIHKYLGLGDGRYGPSDIRQAIRNNPKQENIIDNVKSVDCLIVDECSLISEKVFETIEAACRLKDETLLFGGIQIIFCVDFMQLPPVCNPGDHGHYCLQSKVFHKTFPHWIKLTTVTRTQDEALIKTVSEVFLGDVSPESENFIASLNRPLCASEEDTTDSIKLFSKNMLVDEYNRTCMQKLQGQLYEYKAADSGSDSKLPSVTAQKTLWLKVGCPVVLFQNLSDVLVNGLRGTVVSLQDGPVINFDSIGVVTSIPNVKFSVFDPAAKKDLASRYQYPVKPAFGLTIHTAQGMTLERVEIDCRDIFQPGQLGVAMSRATHSNGLRVINYHPRYAIRPPQIVTEFLQTVTKTHRRNPRLSTTPLLRDQAVGLLASKTSYS